MFFFGILSSVTPYLATILLMGICMLTGQSADSETVDLLGNTDTFAIEQAYSEHSNTLDVEATYKHFERTFIAKNEASTPLYRWKTSLILPCQSKNYQSIDSLAHSNKAPPYFI